MKSNKNSNRFVFNLRDNNRIIEPGIKKKVGTIRKANIDTFPELRGMSINHQILKPGTLRRPHWHPESHEMVYIIAGTGLFGIKGPGERLSLLEANQGDIVFIPRNYLHYFKSINPKSDLEVLVWFNTVKSQSLELNSALVPPGLPTDALFQAYDVISRKDQKKLKNIDRDATPLIPGKISKKPVSLYDGNFKFNLVKQGFSSFKQDKVGEIIGAFNPKSAQNYTKFESLEDLCLANICLEKGAMRQLHWHTKVNELNYVLEGSGEFGIVSPGGDVSEVSKFGPGDLMMFPVGWSHHIKNTGKHKLKFLLAFDNVSIDSIDARQSLDSTIMPDNILTQTLGIDADIIPQSSRTSPFPPLVGPLPKKGRSEKTIPMYKGDIFP